MLTHRTMGLIFANMHDAAVSELTALRSMAAVPFYGRYRMIDFCLSSMVDAGITNIGVITKSNYSSLMDHIGNGRDWDLSRRKGISILPPYLFTEASGGAYHGRVEALSGIKGYIERQDAEYVLMMDTDHVAHPDMDKLVSEHISAGADITVVCRPVDRDPSNLRNCVCLKPDAEGRAREMILNSAEEGFLQSMNIFIISKELLLKLTEEATARMGVMLERDVILPHLNDLNVRCAVYDGFVRRITSLKSYFDISLELTDPDKLDALMAGRKIRTKVHDFPPVRYGIDSACNEAVVADGSIIEGTVDNSVIFRNVTIEKGAVVRNCVIMQGTHVSAGCELEYVITDKDVTISEGKQLKGAASYPLYIKKGSEV